MGLTILHEIFLDILLMRIEYENIQKKFYSILLVPHDIVMNLSNVVFFVKSGYFQLKL